MLPCLFLEAISNGFGLSEQQEVIGAASFRVGAAHVEATKRLHPNQRACAFAVEIQVADMEIAPSFFKSFA